MAANLISLLLPPKTGSPSVYETLREHDQSSDISDIEERAGMILDEENLGQGFQDYDLDQALADAAESQVTTESRAFLGRGPFKQEGHGQPRSESNEAPGRSMTRPRWMHQSRRILETEEADDEVPASLLVEGGAHQVATPEEQPPRGAGRLLPVPPVPGPSTQEARSQWKAAQIQQRLYQDGHGGQAHGTRTSRGNVGLAIVDPKEKALWRWANVENLDNFLKDVYDYFLGNGIWCIILSRALNLLTLGFVVGFSTFLTMCIDFKKIPESTTMSQILVPQCTRKMSGSASFFLWLFTLFWIVKGFQYLLDIRRLRHMHDFYHYLLEIPDTDIQTISWQDIVGRLMSLRDANPTTAAGVSERHRKFMGSQSKQRMDAHDIANRLMRKENYLIALFNKDILDLTLPIPFLRNRQLFSKTLEWNLNLCILDYVFNDQGQVRPLFLKDTHRRALSDGLKRRFLFAGVMNVLCAPFIVIYFMMLYFFRYFTEYQKNPSQLSSRQYTPLAEWKFREFNELWHLFQRRVNMSYPFASRYIDQFPKDKIIQISRFVAFVTGALASVLALASVVDPELFLGFEITADRTVLFYLGIFGTIWAVARGAVPEENLVFDPEFALNSVVEYTHYLPIQWRGRLHSDEVRKDFAMLYQMKVVMFLEEILSIIFTPFVLWFSLPKCSDRLVDFFREFTVHVDGLGYVCSFAVFDFNKGGNNLAQQRQQQQEGGAEGLRDDYYSTKDGKMLASYYGFLDNYSTKPRPGVPFMHPSNKRHFHPPPAFPGLMSSTFAPEMGGPGDVRQERRDRHQHLSTRPATAGAGAQSVHLTPRFARTGGHASPMPSILLDPHHQPSTTGFRTLSRPSTQSRFRQAGRPLSDPIEDEEEALPETTQQPDGITSSGGMANDSNLGESWKTTRAGALDNDNGDEEDVREATSEKGAGVLGLIYQFQKAQTEGRGTGVNI
ncbi:MAG: autophagy protein atg9 [Pleopsidium flavum]|nr:MAG: autophagy protein atg9 [Pleopsidium flavum]